MIIRLVKMTFREEKIPDFLEIFREINEGIAKFPGCTHLELLQDTRDKRIFFTHSHWRSEEDLENYRHSDLFSHTWSRTKPLFAAKAEAWSLNHL